MGKTPIAGAVIEANPIPEIGIGTGFGLFSFEGVTGSFIPVYGNIFFLNSNFTPILTTGINFVTISFESNNSLLKSSFKGSQWNIGAGAEYRFDFGLNLRLEMTYFVPGNLLVPGLLAGYSFHFL